MIAQLQPTDWQSVLLVGGYFLLFGLGAIAMQRWWIAKRQTEIPFGKDVRLQRFPGEAQIELLRKFERNEDTWLVCTALVPLLALEVMFGVVRRFPGYWILVWIALTLLAFGMSLLFAMRFLARRFEEQNDRYLGGFGERFVAECLEPLKLEHWHVFHDVPMDGKTAEFNIDHVVVGVRGLFVVETKTWRRKKTKKGEVKPRIRYDGRTLHCPWGADNSAIEQVERNARDLERILKKETGLDVGAKSIVTFPEWTVDFSSTAPDAKTHAVLSNKLPGFISKGRGNLNADQIESISRALERRCRTVKY